MGRRTFSNSGAGADTNPEGEWRTPQQIIADSKREAAETAAAEQTEKDAEAQR